MRRITYISISLLYLSAIIDPIGSFGLRYISGGFSAFVLLCLFVTGLLQINRGDLRLFIAIWLVLVMPTYGLFRYSMHANGAGFTDTADISTSPLFLTTFLYFDRRATIYGQQSLINALRLLTIVCLAVTPIILLEHGNALTAALIDRNVAILGTRAYSNFTVPYIYFIASPMLIYLVAYELHQCWLTERKLIHIIWASVSIAALLLSGTRAHQFIALTLIPVSLVASKRNSGKLFFSVILFLFCAALFITNANAIIGALFSPTEADNAMKIALLSGYKIIFSSLTQLFFGQGYNAQAWSNTLHGMVNTSIGASKTELTFLEVIRTYGIFVGAPLLLLLTRLGFALKSLPITQRWLLTAYVFYMLDCATNAYLFSSNGMLPLALAAASANYFSSKKSNATLLAPTKKFVSSPAE